MKRAFSTREASLKRILWFPKDTIGRRRLGFLILLLVSLAWFAIPSSHPRIAIRPAPFDVYRLGPISDVPNPPSTLASLPEKPAFLGRVLHLELQRTQLPAQLLLEAGVAPSEAAAALASMQGLVDFRHLLSGDKVTAGVEQDGTLAFLEIAHGPLERARTIRGDGGWSAKRVNVNVYKLLVQVSGEVRTSLWDAVISTGEDPRLVDALVDIFAWDIDFFTEVHASDTFKLLVEKRYVAGEFVGYGLVQAAEFVSAGRVHRAFAAVRNNGQVNYYGADGRGMQKQLLKSPLKFARVTSGFGHRMHPVLGYTRAHNGVDYGVPTGTPVWSVGEGRVVEAGVKGGFGKYVAVAHASGWLSEYGHLSRIFVRPGQHVSQKQIVGAVGQTGMATGPHLHYGLKKRGGYVNPLSQRFERVIALVGEERQRFLVQATKFTSDLERMVVAHGSVVMHRIAG
jgi:murein DD-endopeptidase MepM/ murein hydrolase activator NlpD